MDGILMNALHGNLNRLSERSLRNLVEYFATGILSLQDQYLILNEIIGPKAMSLALKASGSKN
jgi:hypothetical protein